MTAPITTQSTTSAEWSTIRQLGAVEARRMLLHPAYLFCLAFTVLAGAFLVWGDGVGPDPLPGLPYAVAMLFGALFYPLATVVAANRVAAATLRRAPRETLDVTPTREQQRTMAACLGVVRGPALIGVAVMLFMDVIAPFAPTASTLNGLTPRGVLEHLQVPVIVLGGGLLGIALARWVRIPGALALVVLALWFSHLTIADAAQTAGGLVSGPVWLVLIPTWLFTDATMLTPFPVSQEMWHLVYLLGLALLAGVAALLHAPANRRPLLLAGTVLVVITGIAAVLQMG